MRRRPAEPKKTEDMIVMVVVTALLGLTILGLIWGENASKSDLVGQPSPSYRVKTASGKEVSDTAVRGRVVMLDFWATWCPPCKKQMPVLQKVERRHPEVAVLSVNVDDAGPGREAMVQQFLAQRRLDFDVIYDGGPLMRSFQVTHFPTLVVVRPDGVVSYAESGYLDERELEKLILEAKKP